MDGEEEYRNNETNMSAQESNDISIPSVELVKELGEDYAEYLNIDTTQERKKYADTVDEMLTKLDEFCGLVDMIRSDTALCLTRTMPEIQDKCQEMNKIFEKIDKIELFVLMVRENVSRVEEEVNKAEDQMGTMSGIKKIFNSFSIPSFISTKKSLNKQKSETDGNIRFEPPEIFDTQKYFTYRGEETVSKTGGADIAPT